MFSWVLEWQASSNCIILSLAAEETVAPLPRAGKLLHTQYHEPRQSQGGDVPCLDAICKAKL